MGSLGELEGLGDTKAWNKRHWPERARQREHQGQAYFLKCKDVQLFPWTSCGLVERRPAWSHFLFFFFPGFFLTFFFFNFIYFWLWWVFVAARGLSLVAASGGYSSLQCTGFSLRWLLLLRSTGSRRAGFSSCSTRAR